ncbi:hypothetical protein Tco_0363217 [Tanacetum coccineum]
MTFGQKRTLDEREKSMTQEFYDLLEDAPMVNVTEDESMTQIETQSQTQPSSHKTKESHKDNSVADKIKDPTLVHTYHRPPRRGAEEEQNCHLHSRIVDVILPQMLDRLVKAIPINVNILARRVWLDKLPTR